MSIFQKMMAIAGRDQNGKARAVSTDESGTMKVRPVGNSEELAKDELVRAETSFISKAMVAQHPNINIFLSINSSNALWDVDIQYLSDTDVILLTEENIMSGTSTNPTKYNYPLKHLRFRLVFNLRHTSDRTLNTMTVSSVPTPPTYTPKYGDMKVVPLGHVGGVNVDKKSSRNISPREFTSVSPFDGMSSSPYIDVKDFAYLFVVARTDARHEFRVVLTWDYYGGEFSSATGPSTSFVWRSNSESLRAVSEWLEITGGRGRVRILNDDVENDHIYDIVLFGVR